MRPEFSCWIRQRISTLVSNSQRRSTSARLVLPKDSQDDITRPRSKLHLGPKSARSGVEVRSVRPSLNLIRVHTKCSTYSGQSVQLSSAELLAVLVSLAEQHTKRFSSATVRLDSSATQQAWSPSPTLGATWPSCRLGLPTTQTIYLHMSTAQRIIANTATISCHLAAMQARTARCHHRLRPMPRNLHLQQL